MTTEHHQVTDEQRREAYKFFMRLAGEPEYKMHAVIALSDHLELNAYRQRFGAIAHLTATKTELRKTALELYKPPFSFKHGYIWDVNGAMVADQDDQCSIARVRGWGHIARMSNAEEVQDEVGRIIAESLTQFWTRHQPG